MKKSKKPFRLYADKAFYDFVKSHGWVKVYERRPPVVDNYYVYSVTYRIESDGTMTSQCEYNTRGRIRMSNVKMKVEVIE